MSEALRYSTDKLNLATAMLCCGARLEGVSCSLVNRRQRVRPECEFHLLWWGAWWDEVPSTALQQLEEAKAGLRETARLLRALGAPGRADAVAAIAQSLEDPGSLERRLDLFIRLWEAHCLRLEPRDFDKNKLLVVKAMRAARERVIGGSQ